jgi:putative intracellular protease/amidase
VVSSTLSHDLLERYFSYTAVLSQSEFAHPYEVLKDHATISIASPKGGPAPLDPSSVEAAKEDRVSVRFLKENEVLWNNTKKLSNFLGNANQYDAIFFVGGHGRKLNLC